MKIERNSPSNIRTGWNQKYFYKVESDGMLDSFIEMFTKNGNNWSMKKETFDKIVAKEKIDDSFSFSYVYDQVLEIDGDLIRFNEYVVKSLLANNWRWSFRNTLKNLKRAVIEFIKEFAEMAVDGLAFIVDPEARMISDSKYPNGSPMSVRCAKKKGLMK